MLYKDFSTKYITAICRDCLNQASGLNLTTQECIYNWSSHHCPRCGDYRHIVADLRFIGRLKVFFLRDKNK